MLNVVALILLLSSLVTAGVLSPTPIQETQNPKDDIVIVKEGHRAVIVEFEKGGGDVNTKVSISAPQKTHEESASDVDQSSYISVTEEKLSDAEIITKETAEDVKETVEEAFSQTGAGSPARELACDAFGKCKHKLASVIRKAKYTVSEKAQEAGEQAKEVVSEAIEIAGETAEKAKTIGKDVQRNVSRAFDSAKEKIKEMAEQGKETVEQAAERAKTSGNHVKEGGRMALTEILRRCSEVAAAMDWVVGVVHLLGFSTGYGICLWITFVSSYLLAGALPRHQFGMVQSRIYPVYFRVMLFSVSVALVGHLLGKREKLFTSKGEMLQGFHLLSSLLMILINSFYLEPRAKKVMFEKMKIEKEEGRGRVGLVSKRVNSRIAKLNDRLNQLNASSSILNILTLVALTWHLVYLGGRLHLSC